MDKSFLQPSLVGDTLLLIPLESSHFDELYLAASDPLIWVGHPSPLRYQKDEFSRWFEEAITSNALVVVDKNTGQLIGSSRYYEYDAGQREIAIGFTFLTRQYWGGVTNRELKSLMLAHAFTRVNTVWFHVDANNLRSQKAMKKVGAELTQVTEKNISGRLGTYVFFRILKENYSG